MYGTFTLHNHQQNKVLLVLFERDLDEVPTGTTTYNQVHIAHNVTCEITGCVLSSKCWAFIKDTVTCQHSVGEQECCEGLIRQL